MLSMLFYIRLKLFQESVQLKGRLGHDINDFSIFMYNLPYMGTRRLTNLLMKYFRRMNYNNGLNYEIIDVCQIYDTREYLSFKKRSKVLQEEINKLMDDEEFMIASEHESVISGGGVKTKPNTKRKSKER